MTFYQAGVPKSVDKCDAWVTYFARSIPDLPPHEKAWIARYRAAPDEVRLRLFDVLVEALVHERGVKYRYHPSYPKVWGLWASRLLLGDSPEEITGLPRRWAHAVMVEGCGDHLNMVRTLYRLRVPNLWKLRDGRLCSDIKVDLWLMDQWERPDGKRALQKHRREQGPHGEVVEGRFLDRMDEIRPIDLRPSVRETFERAAKRMLRAMMREGANEILATPPRWWRPMKCVVALDTKAKLAGEGRALSHCVGSYVGYVKTGHSWIASIRVPTKEGKIERSTIEFDRQTGEVLQHRGKSNGRPPALCARALDVFLRRIRERGNP